jgi:hypothetical protein
MNPNEERDNARRRIINIVGSRLDAADVTLVSRLLSIISTASEIIGIVEANKSTNKYNYVTQ